MKLVMGMCGHCGAESRHLLIRASTRCGRCGRIGKVQAVALESVKLKKVTPPRVCQILAGTTKRRKDTNVERFYRMYEEHYPGAVGEGTIKMEIPIAGV